MKPPKSLLSEPSSQGRRVALRELLINVPGPGDLVHLESAPVFVHRGSSA